MKEELLKHKLAYTLLALGLTLIVSLFLLVWPNRAYQKILIGVLGLFYFIWGVVTHTKSDRITLRIIMEYGLISLLASLLLWLLVW